MINNNFEKVRKRLKLTNRDFAILIGIGETAYSRLKKGDLPVGDVTLYKIKEALPEYSLDWLLYNKLPELQSDLDRYSKIKPSPDGSGILLEDGRVIGKDPRKEIIPTINGDQKGVPYYDVDFIGGFDLIFNDQTAPSYYIDFPPFNDLDAWANMTGNSMHPLISHGDKIGLINVKDWESFILMGEVYAIVTSNGFRTVKTLGKGETKDEFTLIPYNDSDEYQPQSIPKSMITHIFRVKGSIRTLI